MNREDDRRRLLAFFTGLTSGKLARCSRRRRASSRRGRGVAPEDQPALLLRRDQRGREQAQGPAHEVDLQLFELYLYVHTGAQNDPAIVPSQLSEPAARCDRSGPGPGRHRQRHLHVGRARLALRHQRGPSHFPRGRPRRRSRRDRPDRNPDHGLLGAPPCPSTLSAPASSTARADEHPGDAGALRCAPGRLHRHQFSTKQLYSSKQFPVAIGRGTGKIKGKANFAQFNAQTFNDLFFGLSNPDDGLGAHGRGRSRHRHGEHRHGHQQRHVQPTYGVVLASDHSVFTRVTTSAGGPAVQLQRDDRRLHLQRARRTSRC
jgi:hypothetical protein